MAEFKLDDPAIKGFLFYVSVLVLKTVLMSFLTAKQRFRKKVFISPEDTDAANNVLGMHEATVKYDDEDVERVRRAHLNDLENIPMFIISGFVYILTKPDAMIALYLFRIFTLLRILHTIVYAIIVVPQPTRAILFGISYTINLYMIFVGIVTFFNP